MSATARRVRADAADATCAAAFARALRVQRPEDPEDPRGAALVAVGGYGRRELSPRSDLDVVLVHADGVDVGRLASEVWYPLWDAGVALDHAVRGLGEVAGAAAADLRVALGMLDARHLAGDPAVTLQLRSVLLAQWRRDARARLPQLQDLVRTRVTRFGELAHEAVPDLKESGGGLRDATVLAALVTAWLVDVPHAELERCRRDLLDVRDALHTVTGRTSDRIGPDLWPDLAAALGHAGPEETQRVVRRTGRRLMHLSRLTWRRVDGMPARGAGPRTAGPRTAGPALRPLAPGVAAVGGEVVVRPDAGATDPALLLRAAALAAEHDLALSPHTAARLAREGPALPEPWPEEARDLLVRLLAAGPGLRTVWETLDETGALDRLLPEWRRVRLLPHASPVHRFTVDRHLVETCIEASRLLRRVSRPDLLVVAALLHDIGKGGRLDHSVAGAPVAAAVARRIGFPDEDAAVVATLVRRHLLLVDVATGRDLEDPATLQHVRSLVGGPLVLELLAALTEADARATAPKAWTRWRAALVADLVSRVRDSWTTGDPVEPPEEPWVTIPAGLREDGGAVVVRVQTVAHGSEVTVVARDRTGLLAAVAGALALLRVPVRAARAWSQEEYAVSRWHVEATQLDPAVLRQQVDAVLAGRRDPADRLRPTAGSEPAVAVRADASRSATVLEVRTEDRPGVVHLVCRSLAEIGVAIRSAHVATLGPRAVDVFYLQEESAGALGDERAAEAAHAVRRALTAPVTLDV